MAHFRPNIYRAGYCSDYKRRSVQVYSNIMRVNEELFFLTFESLYSLTIFTVACLIHKGNPSIFNNTLSKIKNKNHSHCY